MTLDGLVVLEENCVDVWVNRAEIAPEVGNQSDHGCLGNGEDAPDNIPDPVDFSGAEVTRNDPTRVREQLDRQAPHVHGH